MDERKVVLSLKNLEVKFNVRARILRAIRNVSLDIYEGQSIAIVGESGSGKSVLTKTFTGMLEENGRITNGEIWFEGQDLVKLQTNKEWQSIRGNKIATVFQDPMTSLNPIKTIGSQISEVIMLHQGKSPSEAKEIAINLIKRVGIANAQNDFMIIRFNIQEE